MNETTEIGFSNLELEIAKPILSEDNTMVVSGNFETIATKIRAKTMFSTHYHEITSIENKLDMIKNVHVAVAERDNDITLLYKVEDGAMGKSYGINVAKLANLPEELIARSSEILEDLLKEEVKTNSNVMRVVENKLPSWVDELKNLDPLSMSPLQALNYLYELKRKMGDK